MATIEAPFSSPREARNVYYGSTSDESTSTGEYTGEPGPESDSEYSLLDPGGGQVYGDIEGSGGRNGWGPLRTGDQLGEGWLLAYQDQQEGGRQRWFVLRSADGQLQALNGSGQVYDATETDTLSDLPHFPNEDDARAAFDTWVSEQERGQEKQPDSSDEWGKWQKVRQVDPWWIYGRVHKTEDKAEFLVASKRSNGTAIYLAPGGKVQEDPHIYTSVEAVQQALEAYAQAVQDGEIPEDHHATGEDPGRQTVSRAVKKKSSGGGAAGDLLARVGGPRRIIAAVVVATLAYYLYQRRSQ